MLKVNAASATFSQSASNGTHPAWCFFVGDPDAGDANDDGGE